MARCGHRVIEKVSSLTGEVLFARCLDCLRHFRLIEAGAGRPGQLALGGPPGALATDGAARIRVPRSSSGRCPECRSVVFREWVFCPLCGEDLGDAGAQPEYVLVALADSQAAEHSPASSERDLRELEEDGFAAREIAGRAEWRLRQQGAFRMPKDCAAAYYGFLVKDHLKLVRCSCGALLRNVPIPWLCRRCGMVVHAGPGVQSASCVFWGAVMGALACSLVRVLSRVAAGSGAATPIGVLLLDVGFGALGGYLYYRWKRKKEWVAVPRRALEAQVAEASRNEP